MVFGFSGFGSTIGDIYKRPSKKTPKNLGKPLVFGPDFGSGFRGFRIRDSGIPGFPGLVRIPVFPVEWGDRSRVRKVPKNPKKPKKPEKTRKMGVFEKRPKLAIFHFSGFWPKMAKNGLLIAPLAGCTNENPRGPRGHFFAVLVLVVGGVQSGGNFFLRFFPGFFDVSGPGFSILGVDIIPGGGGGGGGKRNFFLFFV